MSKEIKRKDKYTISLSINRDLDFYQINELIAEVQKLKLSKINIGDIVIQCQIGLGGENHDKIIDYEFIKITNIRIDEHSKRNFDYTFNLNSDKTTHTTLINSFKREMPYTKENLKKVAESSGKRKYPNITKWC